MSATVLLCGGLPLSAALAAGLVGSLAGVASAAALARPAASASPTAADASGSLQACVAYAYTAIEQHKVITATPPACRGLGRAEVNQAAGIAIRMTLTSGAKSARRKQAVAAAHWAGALITGPAPVRRPGASAAPVHPAAGGPVNGLGLGGVSELAAKVGALLAWLATAASGGWVLVRWLLAGGSPLRRTMTAAPPAVILGHVGTAALGLVLWVSFLLSGWVALAWTALAILAPVAGLGMGVLLLGLPGPARPPIGAGAIGARAIGARVPGRRARIPVLAIVAHGMFAVTTLLLVLMATIGAG
jgi:manganese efflux pump family protein